MRLSAADVRQQQFGIKLLRGFDPQEVDAFLEEVADDLEELTRENNLLKEQLVAAEERARSGEGRERTLQETLVTTQRIAEDFKENARAQAELFVREARLQADKLMAETREEHARLLAEVSTLKRQRRQLAEELLAVLAGHKRMIEPLLGDGGA